MEFYLLHTIDKGRVTFDWVLFGDFLIFPFNGGIIWFVQTLTFGWLITMVTVLNVTMVTMVMYIYPLR